MVYIYDSLRYCQTGSGWVRLNIYENTLTFPAKIRYVYVHSAKLNSIVLNFWIELEIGTLEASISL